MRNRRHGSQSYKKNHGTPERNDYPEIKETILMEESGVVDLEFDIAAFVEADYEEASSQAMTERHEYQVQRYRELRFENSLTPEWKKFGRNHESEI